jgi:hypothetical protein
LAWRFFTCCNVVKVLELKGIQQSSRGGKQSL